MKADSDDNMKMVKLVILYFIELVLLEKVNRNYTNETYVLFVDNFNKLNEYPQRRSSFKMTIESLRIGVVGCVAKHKKKLNADCKYKGAMYNVHGFLHDFLVIKLN